MGITVIVTGTEKSQLTPEMTDALKRAGKIVLHTGFCGCAEWLTENGIGFETLDSLYETSEDFDGHAAAAARSILEAGDVCYCVLNERDESLKELVRACPQLALIGPVTARATAPVVTLGAYETEGVNIPAGFSVYVTEIDNRICAGEVKLRLMDIYGDEARAYITKPDGSGACMPLEMLDRLKDYNHKCSCLVNPTGARADFDALMLRGRDKLYENNDIDAETLARSLADVVRCMCAGETYDLFTAREIFDLAMEEI